MTVDDRRRGHQCGADEQDRAGVRSGAACQPRADSADDYTGGESRMEAIHHPDVRGGLDRVRARVDRDVESAGRRADDEQQDEEDPW